jgi:lysophospholipase L1-like esterase
MSIRVAITLGVASGIAAPLLLMSPIHAAPPAGPQAPPVAVAPPVPATPPVIATCPGDPAVAHTIAAPAADCDPTGPIVALGDSITYGYGVTMTAYSTPPRGSYPWDLQQMLGIPVVNAGVNGDTAYSALHPSTPGFGHRPAGLQIPALLALHPRLVVVEFGSAEAIYGWPMSVATAGLDALLTALGDVPTVIVGTHADCATLHICLGGDTVQYTGEWDAQLRTLAARHHSGLVLDATGGLAQAGDMSDVLHPNLGGYRVMAERVAPAVRDRLAGAASGDHSGGTIIPS